MGEKRPQFQNSFLLICRDPVPCHRRSGDEINEQFDEWAWRFTEEEHALENGWRKKIGQLHKAHFLLIYHLGKAAHNLH